MATLTDLNTRIDLAIAALDGGSYASCITHCNAALLMIAAMPDTVFDTTDQIRFDRQGATQAIQAVKRSASQRMAGGEIVVSQPVLYTRDGVRNDLTDYYD